MPPKISNFLIVFVVLFMLHAIFQYKNNNNRHTDRPDYSHGRRKSAKFASGDGDDSNVKYFHHQGVQSSQNEIDKIDKIAELPRETMVTHTGETKAKPDAKPKDKPTKLAPCGEICTYKGTLAANDTGFYPQWYKSINCKNIMKRMAYRDYPVIDPPPTEPPEELIDDFTMHGQMSLQYQYRKARALNRSIVFTNRLIKDYIAKVLKGKNVNDYTNGTCVQQLLAQYKDKINGKRGLIIGSIGPWLESILLANEANHLTTLEYAKLVSEDPRISTFIPYDYADIYLNNGNFQKFDFAASFSSIEHSGLGRYYDPINPFGDFEAVAQVWCMVKPGGYFGLGVPWRGDNDILFWNVHRAYGDKRLQHLTANWNVMDKTSCAGHQFFILKKPSHPDPGS